MFNRENKTIDPKTAETVIGPSIRVKGNFHGQGDIVIEGIVEGSVKTNSYLLVGKKAKITASIEAGDAQIGGEVTGDIKIKGYVEITATAKINGNIEANQISIEKGAVLNGRCTMSKEEKAHAEEKK